MNKGMYIFYLLLMTTALSFGQKKDTIISTDCNGDGINDSLVLPLKIEREYNEFSFKISPNSWVHEIHSIELPAFANVQALPVPNQLLIPKNVGCKNIVKDILFKDFSQKNTSEVDWCFQYQKNDWTTLTSKENKHLKETFSKFEKQRIDEKNFCIGCKQLKTITTKQNMFYEKYSEGADFARGDSLWASTELRINSNKIDSISKIAINSKDTVVRLQNLFYLKEKDSYSILFLDFLPSHDYDILCNKNEIVLFLKNSGSQFIFINFKLSKIYAFYLDGVVIDGLSNVAYRSHELKMVLDGGEVIKYKIRYQ